MKILIAEDDPICRHLLTRTLEKWGYETVRCSDGYEALRIIREEEIPLAILDWEMPKMKGIDVCRQVRQMPGIQPYLVMLTSRDSQSDLIAGLEAGADDFIRKPFDQAELRARLKAGQRISGLERTLREQSLRDPLTGLHNRRFMEDVLLRELARARRSGASVGIVMVDIDHFKRVNDTYGHPAGDYVLKTVAAFLKDHVRSADITCRFGGEEFVLILPDASAEATITRMELLRRGISKLQLWHSGKSIGPICFSAGVAVFPKDGDTPEQLLSNADSALYSAKLSGRNRIVLHSQTASCLEMEVPWAV